MVAFRCSAGQRLVRVDPQLHRICWPELSFQTGHVARSHLFQPHGWPDLWLHRVRRFHLRKAHERLAADVSRHRPDGVPLLYRKYHLAFRHRHFRDRVAIPVPQLKADDLPEFPARPLPRGLHRPLSIGSIAHVG